MIDGKMYPLENVNFPTIHPKNPYELSEDEEWVINRLQYDFLNSQSLQRHISFLYSKGNMYTIYNDNLLIHGCIPLNEDGSFMAVDVNGKKYKGKALLDQFEEILRKAYLNRQEDETKNPALDYLWYMWQGVGSSLFGKTKMTTFERRSEEHTSELQSRGHLVCRLLLEKKKTKSHPHRKAPDYPQNHLHAYRNRKH